VLILYFILIILLSAFTFWRSFHLALFGDDWLAFWRYLQHLGPKSSGEWNHLTYFLTPYGAQDIMMGVLQKIIGYSSTWYYVSSYILRLLAAFSLYPLVYYLTRSKLSAFFAVLFFSVTITGFDTTNWSSNMTSYITIALFNLFLYFFIKERDDNKPISLIISAILYYFAYITTPIRMHGSIPLIFLLELFWVLQKRDSKTIKKAILRLLLIIAVFIFIKFTGQSLGPSNEPAERLVLGLKTSLELISQGKIAFLSYPVIILGSILIPDFILPSIGRNPILFLTGVCILATVFFLIIKFFKRTNISTVLFLGLTWSLLSFFFAWWRDPTIIFPTISRYLIVSVQGISIMLATLISISKEKGRQISIFTFLCIILIVHIIATRIYTNYLLNSHGQENSNKIWSSIPYVPEIGKKKEPIIFYFEGDPGTENIIHDTITFGFPPHMALLYNLREGDADLPVAVSNWQDIVSAVTTGNTLKAWGYKTDSLPAENVYAFYLKDKDNLVNITDIARNKLKEISNNK